MKYKIILESIINKQYLSFNSIVQNENLALSINKFGSNIDVICYDTTLIFDEFKGFIYRIQEAEKLNSILFAGRIYYDNKAPLGTVSVNFAIAHPTVSGINILYPLLAVISKTYFNEGLLYSDHKTGYVPSDDAQKVWNKFYSQDIWQLEKIIPVDDKKQKLTPSTLDDGMVHFKIRHPVIDYFRDKENIYSLLNKLKKDDSLLNKIKEMISQINNFSEKQINLNQNDIDETINELKQNEDNILKNILYKFRKPMDWIFKLKNNNDINISDIDLLQKRNNDFIKKSSWIQSKKDFANDLKNLANIYYISEEKYRIVK